MFGLWSRKRGERTLEVIEDTPAAELDASRASGLARHDGSLGGSTLDGGSEGRDGDDDGVEGEHFG